MERDQAQTMVHDVGNLIGIPDLELDENGVCTLSLDDDRFYISVLHEVEGSLTAIVTLRDIEPTEMLLQHALEANHLWQATQGATFTLEPGEGKLTLGKSATDAKDAQSLFAILEQLLDSARAWHDEFLDIHLDHTTHEGNLADADAGASQELHSAIKV